MLASSYAWTDAEAASSLAQRNNEISPLIYAPLTDGQIRVVTLHKGDSQSATICTLHVVDVDDNTTYDALSYVWGNEDNSIPITVNGQIYSITENLAKALKFLKHPDHDRTLWVDTLCINQSNDVERSLQVRIMHEIYSNAAAVLAWLGSGDILSNLAMTLLQEAETNNFEAPWFQQLVERCNNGQLEARQSLASLYALTINDYWTRLWVVQEILYAREAFILLGPRQVHWWSMTELVELVIENLPWFQDEQLYQAIDASTRMLRVFNPRTGLSDTDHTISTLVPIAAMVRTKLCKDLPDRVYACRSLLRREIRDRIDVDYSLTVRELFISVAHTLMKYMGNIDLIVWNSGCKDDLAQDAVANLPTWVSDWGLSIITSSGHMNTITLCENAYGSFSFNDDGSILQTVGQQLGIVHDFEPTTTEQMQVGMPIADVVTYLKVFLAAVQRRGPIDETMLLQTLHRGDEDLLEGFDLDAWLQMFAKLRQGVDVERFSKDETQAMRKALDAVDSCALLFLTATEGGQNQDNLKTMGPSHPFPKVGLGFQNVQAGDLVCILSGCSTPMVLRLLQEQGQYEVICDAFLIGFTPEVCRGLVENLDSLEKFDLC